MSIDTDTERTVEGWLLPSMPYKLVGVKALRKLGFGLSIGLEAKDYLIRKRSGKRTERVPVLDFDGVYVFKAKPKPKSTVGASIRSPAFVSARKSQPNQQPRSFLARLQGDYFWNTAIDMEEQEDAAACNEADGLVSKFESCDREAKRRKVSSEKSRRAFLGVAMLLTVVVAAIAVPMRLWHNRMGHINSDRLNHDINHGHVKNVTVIGKSTFKPCSDCRCSKLVRSSFDKLNQMTLDDQALALTKE